MPPTSKAAATRAKNAQASVKEKVFHPQSRKASQLERAGLRKSKLAGASARRSKKQIEKASRYGFFRDVLDPNIEALTLSELHFLVTKLWLTRHDIEIQAEEKARRKGRPPGKKEIDLKEAKVRDADEYRSGLDLPDLTDPVVVTTFRKWQGNDPAYLHLVRFIRISSANPTLAPVVKYGLQEEADRKKEAAEKTTNDMELDHT